MNKFLNKKILAIILGLIILVGLTVWSYWGKNKLSKTSTVEIGRTSDNQPIVVSYDLKYSFRDFTHQNLKDAKDLDNKTIYASVFLHEIPDSQVFPDNMNNVTFINCNLDNVYIPPGNKVIGGSQKRFITNPADGEDWLVDEKNNFIKKLSDL